ncbi:MAG: type II toxin-antitoxin system HipA family toxin [Verrucomicrobiales bacterium]
MTTTAKTFLFGTHVASITWDDDRELGLFEYHPDFLDSRIEIAPLTMPLRSGVFTFQNLPRETFKGLPGLLADSLPDKFGNMLINQWLADQGRTPESFNPVERLCYIGSRGMGALEFEPTLSARLPSSPLDVERLIELANLALDRRRGLHARLDTAPGLAEIVRVGTSAGGARAKAIVAWNQDTGEIRSGQLNAPQGFEPWLIKFDGVRENSDKESADPQGYGRIEYAYHLMAREAGIDMSDCHLLEENGRAHFMTKRFDRTPGGDKLHLQTLCGIAHMDFNQAGAHSYEQAFLVARQLGLSYPEQLELYRRAVFNIVSRNQDDHTKNISFTMDRSGNWQLAPAYDIIYSYNPNGAWTDRHQMSLSGKRDDFAAIDLLDAAKAANVKKTQAIEAIDQIVAAVTQWQRFADQAGVPKSQAFAIAQVHRLL